MHAAFSSDYFVKFDKIKKIGRAKDRISKFFDRKLNFLFPFFEFCFDRVDLGYRSTVHFYTFVGD